MKLLLRRDEVRNKPHLRMQVDGRAAWQWADDMANDKVVELLRAAEEDAPDDVCVEVEAKVPRDPPTVEVVVKEKAPPPKPLTPPPRVDKGPYPLPAARYWGDETGFYYFTSPDPP